MKGLERLRSKSLFLFDMDGVFYKGKDHPVKLGGTRVVEAVRSAGKRLFVLTNNSTDTGDTIHSNFERLGIPVGRDEILTSAILTADYLRTEYGGATYFLVGEEGFDQELRSAGLSPASEKADVVVIGLDRFLTYAKLDAAVKAAKAGADLVATHSAMVYMSGAGPALGPGPIVRAIEVASGKKAVSIGKPSPLMFKIALRRAGCRPSEAVMVGDQLDTDVAGAARAGIDSVLVLTGIDKSIRGTKALGVVGNVDELAAYV